MIQTVLGFDFGERRIGIATGQTITSNATPLTTLKAINQKPDWQSIEKIIAEWKPDALIVGIPTYLDGSQSEMTLKAEKFCRQLEGRFKIAGLDGFPIVRVVDASGDPDLADLSQSCEIEGILQ